MIPITDQNERHSHSEVVIIHPDFSSKYSWIIRIWVRTPQYLINQAISTRMMVGCLSKIKAHHMYDFEGSVFSGTLQHPLQQWFHHPSAPKQTQKKTKQRASFEWGLYTYGN